MDLDQGEPLHPLAAPPRKRTGRPWLLVVGLAIALVVGMAILYPRSRDAVPPAPPTEAAGKPADAPGPPPKDCDVCPEMVEVPAGEVLMGAPPADQDADEAERPQHRVVIARPFAISRTEITFDGWEACLREGGCMVRPPHEGWGRSKRPVINVTWFDAQSYVRWVSAKTGRRYRLPTEAEWEYATRAGTATRYWWGDEIGIGKANCEGCGSRWDDSQTAPVSQFTANPFGLFDVHGNVWEWVEDCPSPNYRAAPADGSAVLSGRLCQQRVIRGGSWDNTPPRLRASARAWVGVETRSNIIGFRVVRE